MPAWLPHCCLRSHMTALTMVAPSYMPLRARGNKLFVLHCAGAIKLARRMRWSGSNGPPRACQQKARRENRQSANAADSERQPAPCVIGPPIGGALQSTCLARHCTTLCLSLSFPFPFRLPFPLPFPLKEREKENER